MVLLDLLGRRWALRVLWELRGGRKLTFRELQSACGQISSSVLNERLGELRGAGIVTRDGGRGYQLSAEGRGLLRALAPIEAWSRQWAERRRAEDLEAEDPS
jgi:DNA-binding HxlR family transcriptional regulator